MGENAVWYPYTALPRVSGLSTNCVKPEPSAAAAKMPFGLAMMRRGTTAVSASLLASRVGTAVGSLVGVAVAEDRVGAAVNVGSGEGTVVAVCTAVISRSLVGATVPVTAVCSDTPEHPASAINRQINSKKEEHLIIIYLITFPD